MEKEGMEHDTKGKGENRTKRSMIILRRDQWLYSEEINDYTPQHLSFKLIPY